MNKKERDRRDYLLNREKRLAQMGARIEKLRAAGLCVQCGKEKAGFSVSRCEVCLEDVRIRMKNKRQKTK